MVEGEAQSHRWPLRSPAPRPGWRKDCATCKGAARDAPSPVGGTLHVLGDGWLIPARTGEGRAPCDGERRVNTSLGLGLGCEGLGEGDRARPSAKVSREGSQQERDSVAWPPAVVLRALSSGLFGDRHILQRRFIRSTGKRRLNSRRLSHWHRHARSFPHAPERLSCVPRPAGLVLSHLPSGQD